MFVFVYVGTWGVYIYVQIEVTCGREETVWAHFGP